LENTRKTQQSYPSHNHPPHPQTPKRSSAAKTTAPTVKLFVQTEQPQHLFPQSVSDPSRRVQIVEEEDEENNEDLDAELVSELGELAQSEQIDLRDEDVNDIDH
jgi:hypothetical protein